MNTYRQMVIPTKSLGILYLGALNGQLRRGMFAPWVRHGEQAMTFLMLPN